ncbi:MAG TPA: DsbC family protein [Mariprofundaceae bacterium]|nr:DsbC family protein [Mariprofundaceae bacterium]
MRNRLLTFALLAPLWASFSAPLPAAAAGDEAPAAIAQQIRAGIPDLKIDAVRPTPMEGIYEIQVGHVVYYSDAEGRHLIAGGHMFETATHRDITRERLEDINRIDWSVLPLDKAIVSGDKNAKLKLAVFTDPECPYCKRLETELKDMKGVKVYTFLFPLTQIHPHAQAKAEAIWCSKDRHDTMMKVMLEDATPTIGTCDTPIAEIQQLAQKLGISGTPTMIAGDGRMFAGVMAADQLKAWLEKK